MKKTWVMQAVEKFEGPLLNYARRLVRDALRAEDYVQDTFLKLCDQNYEDIKHKLGPWLFTVLRNRIFDEKRKEKKMKLVSNEDFSGNSDAEATVVDRIETNEGSSQVLRLLKNLPESQQEAVRLKFQNGFSYKEIAEIMQLTTNHVGVLIHHAMSTLRGQLQ